MAALDDDKAAEILIDTQVESAGTSVVVLTGELDISNVAKLDATVASITAKGPQQLIFDLSRLRFMDSAGIAVLVGAASTVSSVRLRNPSPVVRRVVEVTGLSQLLPIEQ